MTRHLRPADPGPDRLADLLRDLADERQDDPQGGASEGGDGRHRGGVSILTVPRSLRSLDVAVGLRAVRGMLVVALVVVLVLTGRWAWALRSAGPERAGEVVTGSSVQTGRDPATGPAGPSAPADAEARSTDAPAADAGGKPRIPPSPPHLLVHVAGQVDRPGVVKIPVGSRVIDAVDAAGGFTAEADQSVLNLARPVVDGEQVWVGRPGEPPPLSATAPPAGMPPGSGAGADGAGQGGAAGGAAPPLDLNTATQADLEELPGIGPVTAGHILAWRDAHGSFTRVDELLEVPGIGERTLAQLEPLVRAGG